MTAETPVCWLCERELRVPGRPLLIEVHPDARPGECVGCCWPLGPTEEQAAAHQQHEATR